MSHNHYKQDTLKLLDLLNKYNFKKIKIDLFKLDFFNNLYNDFTKNIKNINLKNVNLKKIDCEHSIEFNNFLSEEVYNKMNKLNNCYIINYENINIKYFTKRSLKRIPLKFYDYLKIIKTLKILFNRNDYKQNIELYDLNLKKVFPKKDNILGPDNVNTAWCMINTHNNGSIVIYRNEELIKVLIHELLHANKVDSELIFSNTSKEIDKKICSNYNILLNEGFTETYSTIIHLYWIGYKLNKSKKYINSLFNNEIKYSMYICSKIFKYYSIDNINKIIKNNNKCKLIFKQKSNVFSYYIIKLILFINIKDFSNLMENYTKYYSIYNKKFLKEFLNLILKNLKNINKYLIKINDKNKSLKLVLYDLHP